MARTQARTDVATGIQAARHEMNPSKYRSPKPNPGATAKSAGSFLGGRKRAYESKMRAGVRAAGIAKAQKGPSGNLQPHGSPAPRSPKTGRFTKA